MNKFLALSAALFSLSAFAARPGQTQAEFVNDVRSELATTGSDVFEGELSTGGDCTVQMIETTHPTTGQPRILVQMNQGDRKLVQFLVDAKDTVKMRLSDGGDGSYAKDWDRGGARLERTHFDDASDSWVIDDGATKLTCEVDY